MTTNCSGSRRQFLWETGAGFAGLALSALHGEQSSVQFYLAGIASVGFGLFALTLPHTPPKKVGQDVPVAEIRSALREVTS